VSRREATAAQIGDVDERVEAVEERRRPQHGRVAPPPDPAAARRKRLRRIIQVGVSVVIVVAIFVFAIPKIADYGKVWKTITSLTWLEFVTLFAAMIFNLFFVNLVTAGLHSYAGVG